MNEINFKDVYEALEFASKQVIVPFGSTDKSKPNPSYSQRLVDENVAVDLSEFNKLFIELFGKEQFDKCPLFIDKFEFIGKHWDDLK